jgi:polar amino acid transport system substrate-binding protein
MGCTARLVEMPWARALAELRAGKLDILPGTLRNPERQTFAHFVVGRWYSRNVLFAHVAAREYWPKASLDEIRHSSFRLGAQIGVSYGPEFTLLDRDPDFHAQLTLSGSRMALWKMLELRRIDGLIADEWTARYELAQLGLQASVRATPLVVSDEASSFAFSKATVQQEFVDRFEATLEAMQRDGSYAAIVRKYVPEATPPRR